MFGGRGREEVGVGVCGEDLVDSESESFSQTMSGVQIRSGRERTSKGGARSASLCLFGTGHWLNLVQVWRFQLTLPLAHDGQRSWPRGTDSA